MKKYYLLFSIIIAVTKVFAQSNKPNVLFIAIDDLKPAIGCYGNDLIHSPNMDDLADSGIMFTNAHTQQAVCGPSRASLLTGMRPDYTKVWDLETLIRDMNPDILTLPQHFKNNGYSTVAIGKIFDLRSVDKSHDAVSWTIPYSESTDYPYLAEYGDPLYGHFLSEEAKSIIPQLEQEANDAGVDDVRDYVLSRYNPSSECIDIPDEAYQDGQIALKALEYIDQLSQNDNPFFVAVGFKKPHLPFVSPKKYWDLYDRNSITLAEYQNPVLDGLSYAYHSNFEIESYTDISALTDFSDIFVDKIPDDKQKELIHAYYASVSYVDAQIGKIINKLKELNLYENTVIVLWGDHGFHLGDHSMWHKHSNFENATRVPFIIKTPNTSQTVYSKPVELVDIFPTLCDLSGIEKPAILQGKSLNPIIDNSNYEVKKYAVSQYPRWIRMGYSIRTERFRLTTWIKEYRSTEPYDESLVTGVELYDYLVDPLETTNRHGYSNYADIEQELKGYLLEHINQMNGITLSENNFNYQNNFIYPNPTKDNLTIVSNTNILNYSIYNYLGNIVLKGNSTKEINTEKLKPGTYFLRYRDSNNRLFSFKFVKE